MNVKQLKELLSHMPDDLEVFSWLPGSMIELEPNVFTNTSSLTGDRFVVCIEGNVVEGSALDIP